MKKLMPNLKYCFRSGAYFGLIVLLVSFGLGCASTHKTTKTTVTTYSSAQQDQKDYNNKGYIVRNQESPGVERSETTTTTTTDTKAAEQPGILSSTVHAIGYVLALPFIIIGGLFRMIF